MSNDIKGLQASTVARTIGAVSSEIRAMQATIIAAMHNKFAPCLAALEGHINAATDHLGATEQSTNMLRGAILSNEIISKYNC